MKYSANAALSDLAPQCVSLITAILTVTPHYQ
jgi:hypothetical protein